MDEPDVQFRTCGSCCDIEAALCGVLLLGFLIPELNNGAILLQKEHAESNEAPLARQQCCNIACVPRKVLLCCCLYTGSIYVRTCSASQVILKE